MCSCCVVVDACWAKYQSPLVVGAFKGRARKLWVLLVAPESIFTRAGWLSVTRRPRHRVEQSCKEKNMIGCSFTCVSLWVEPRVLVEVERG